MLFQVKGIKRANIARFCSIKCRDISRSYVIKKGVKINMLTSIREAEHEIQYCKGKAGSIRKVMCKCDCGNIVVTRLVNFRNGITKSCGCLTLKQSEINIGAKTHGLSGHPLYTVWSNMIGRCYDTKVKSYHSYGGIGITVCDEWRNDFKVFYDWAISNGWEKGLELDKDIKGGNIYSPDYCLFVTREVNCNNKRLSKRVILDGEVYSISEVSEKYNIPKSRVYKLFKNNIVNRIDINDSKHNI